MGTIYMVFVAAVIVTGVVFFSRSAIKRSLRQRKTHAVLAMVRQLTEK